MNRKGEEAGPKTYWLTWLALLILTVGMVFVSKAPLPRVLLLGLLITAMAIKASLIGGYFMHLRFEKFSLTLTVLLGMVLVGCILFFVIAPDGLRIFKLSPH